MTPETAGFKWVDVKETNPYGEVLAINHQQTILVGTCSQEGDTWVCQDDCQRLEGVTHYVETNTLLTLHEQQFPL